MPYSCLNQYIAQPERCRLLAGHSGIPNEEENAKMVFGKTMRRIIRIRAGYSILKACAGNQAFFSGK
jgi:hypothetical protein